MNKLSPRLQTALRSGSPDSDTPFQLIVILAESIDWLEGTRLVGEAGLQIDSAWEELRTVSGNAHRQSIQRINDSHAVASVDLDAVATTTNGP